MAAPPLPDNQAVLQFDVFQSAVNPTFWHALSKQKIEVYRLDDSPRDITGTYEVPVSRMRASSSITARVSGTRLDVSSESFTTASRPTTATTQMAPGTLRNMNTIEEFKNLDKAALFSSVAERIWEDITSGAAVEHPSLLSRFLLLTFADLKKYKFWYWFGFPALLPEAPFRVERTCAIGDVYGEEEIKSLRQSFESVALPYFLVKVGNGGLEARKLSDWDAVADMNKGSEPVVGFLDPSAEPSNPGWPLRNFLVLLKERFKVTKVRVICYRDTPTNTTAPSTSIVCDVQLTGASSVSCPKAVGWEKNPAGKLTPRSADLGPLMDPAQLADTAVDLNLKLMRWRIMPSLNLEKISATKVLLLGSGTLGCYVARALLAWGVRSITFVDNGRVSYSNPVRQPLFGFEDCLDGGQPKAQAAAANLKKVFPGVNSVGRSLSIPMPGHGSTETRGQTEKDIDELKTLIEAHDAVFLLTDSRESRWLPTVLGASLGKIVINSALGFDTFLVMRHGMKTPTPASLEPLPPSPATPSSHVALGCYFCNDVVAPVDSLSDRTLDQQCTVTRPGLSAIASASAVELLVSILNHPLGAHAPAAAQPSHPSEPTPTPLGLVPHQIRGFLTHFTNLLVTGHAYDRCTACSERVLGAYRKGGTDFLLKCIENPDHLEDVAGLKEMKRESDEAAWEIEEGDEDGW
ncbi:Autophagy protein 7 [Thoreauomyces humboldtii]|nr:Autophagy protein 7 [Thoreauomyces humboldtii]